MHWLAVVKFLLLSVRPGGPATRCRRGDSFIDVCTRYLATPDDTERSYSVLHCLLHRAWRGNRNRKCVFCSSVVFIVNVLVCFCSFVETKKRKSFVVILLSHAKLLQPKLILCRYKHEICFRFRKQLIWTTGWFFTGPQRRRNGSRRSAEIHRVWCHGDGEHGSWRRWTEQQRHSRPHNGRWYVKSRIS